MKMERRKDFTSEDDFYKYFADSYTLEGEEEELGEEEGLFDDEDIEDLDEDDLEEEEEEELFEDYAFDDEYLYGDDG